MKPTLISFSGGRSSAYMTYQLVDGGIENHVIVFANTGREKTETLDFVNECDKRWNLNVVWIEYIPHAPGFKIVTYETASRKGEPFKAMLAKRGYKYLPNQAQRFCTGDLKVKPMKKYMQSLGYKRWHVAMGIRADEQFRAAKFLANTQKEPFEYVLPMVTDFPTTKPQVKFWWKEQEFDLQLEDHEGNCDACFMKGIAKKIALVRADPNVFDAWIDDEDKATEACGKKVTYTKGISYREIKEKALSQQTLALVDITPEPCYCDFNS